MRRHTPCAGRRSAVAISWDDPVRASDMRARGWIVHVLDQSEVGRPAAQDRRILGGDAMTESEPSGAQAKVLWPWAKRQRLSGFSPSGH